MADRAHVGALWRAEAQDDRRAVGGGEDGEGDGLDGVADSVAEQVGREPGRRRLVVVAGRVEADDGVEVDDAAVLVFGDLDVPNAGEVAEISDTKPGAARAVAYMIRSSPEARSTARVLPLSRTG